MIDVVIGWMGGWGRKKEDEEEESFFDKYLIDSIIHLYYYILRDYED